MSESGSVVDYCWRRPGAPEGHGCIYYARVAADAGTAEIAIRLCISAIRPECAEACAGCHYLRVSVGSEAAVIRYLIERAHGVAGQRLG